MTLEERKDYWERVVPFIKLDHNPKADYEEKRKFRYDLQDYMHKVFEFDKYQGKKVLEVGFGSGIDLLEFARNGAECYGVDLTENGVKNARAISKESGYFINVRQADATNLPFGDGAFDLVYSFGVLHHIPDDDRVKVFNEIHRVLKPQGKVMAMLYHRDSLLYAYSIIYRHGIRQGLLAMGMSEQELIAKYSERIENCPYTKVYTKDEAKEYFGRWFKNVEVSVHYNVIDTDTQRKVKYVMDEDKEYGWHLAVKGVK